MNASRQQGIAVTVIEGEYTNQKKILKVLTGKWKEPRAGERNTGHSRKGTSKEASHRGGGGAALNRPLISKGF